MGILYKKKKYLYPLVIILKEPVLYRNSIINLKIKPIQVNIKGRSIIINSNTSLLELDEVVLKII